MTQFREMMKQKVLVLVLVPVLAVVGLILAVLFTGSEDRRQEIADALLDEFANLATNYMVSANNINDLEAALDGFVLRVDRLAGDRNEAEISTIWRVLTGTPIGQPGDFSQPESKSQLDRAFGKWESLKQEIRQWKLDCSLGPA